VVQGPLCNAEVRSARKDHGQSNSDPNHPGNPAWIVLGRVRVRPGRQAWPENPPFHTPVFVVTHEKRAPWERLGGTTFHFVNDGIENALDQAREAAGDRDVRIAGGGATILEYVNAGLIDEFSIALSPVLFGSGIRLFEGVDAGRVALEPVRAEPTQRVTHLTYAVRER
jgi:dihydrofolate reductase